MVKVLNEQINIIAINDRWMIRNTRMTTSTASDATTTKQQFIYMKKKAYHRKYFFDNS